MKHCPRCRPPSAQAGPVLGQLICFLRPRLSGIQAGSKLADPYRRGSSEEDARGGWWAKTPDRFIDMKLSCMK
jgi:hypothetical protein